MSFTIDEAVAEYQKIVEDRASLRIDDTGVRERVAQLNERCATNGVIFKADADTVLKTVRGSNPQPNADDGLGDIDETSFDNDWSDSWSY